jgi:hypothetical protein
MSTDKAGPSFRRSLLRRKDKAAKPLQLGSAGSEAGISLWNRICDCIELQTERKPAPTRRGERRGGYAFQELMLSATELKRALSNASSLRKILEAVAKHLNSTKPSPASGSLLALRPLARLLLHDVSSSLALYTATYSSSLPSTTNRERSGNALEAAPLLHADPDHHTHGYHPRTVSRVVDRIKALTMELLPIEVDLGEWLHLASFARHLGE